MSRATATCHDQYCICVLRVYHGMGHALTFAICKCCMHVKIYITKNKTDKYLYIYINICTYITYHYMDVWSEKKLHSSTKSRQFPVSWFKSFWSWLPTTCWSQSFFDMASFTLRQGPWGGHAWMERMLPACACTLSCGMLEITWKSPRKKQVLFDQLLTRSFSASILTSLAQMNE